MPHVHAALVEVFSFSMCSDVPCSREVRRLIGVRARQCTCAQIVCKKDTCCPAVPASGVTAGALVLPTCT
jgi:hypothetical protein